MSVALFQHGYAARGVIEPPFEERFSLENGCLKPGAADNEVAALDLQRRHLYPAVAY